MKQLLENDLQEITHILKALSDVTRLKIMQYLHDQEACVGEIVENVGTGQANISKHLQLLSRAHLVKTRREGTTIYYRISGPYISQLCQSICKGYETILSKRFSTKKK